MSGYSVDERRGRTWAQPRPDELTDTAGALAAAEPRVDAVYLFGSHSTGSVRPTSDVDFAVLLDSEVPLEDVLSLQYSLEEAAEKNLAPPVDVVGAQKSP